MRKLLLSFLFSAVVMFGSSWVLEGAVIVPLTMAVAAVLTVPLGLGLFRVLDSK